MTWLGTRRTTVGWTLPAAVIGGVSSVAGYAEYRSVKSTYVICTLSSMTQQLGSILGTDGSRSPSDCSSIDARYTVSIWIIRAGLLVLIIAAVAALRRLNAATKAGTPWWIYRTLSRWCVWLDRKLPGKQNPERPRISVTALTALTLVAFGISANAAHASWTHHEHALTKQRFLRAEQHLTSLHIPADLTVGDIGGCHTGADQRCASTTKTAQQIAPELIQLIHGRPTTLLCALTHFDGAPPCPITIYGQIAGSPAAIDIFQHAIFVKTGNPPSGAVPVRPGNKHAFFLGSEVWISLIDPQNHD